MPKRNSGNGECGAEIGICDNSPNYHIVYDALKIWRCKYTPNRLKWTFTYTSIAMILDIVYIHCVTYCLELPTVHRLVPQHLHHTLNRPSSWSVGVTNSPAKSRRLPHYGPCTSSTSRAMSYHLLEVPDRIHIHKIIRNPEVRARRLCGIYKLYRAAHESYANGAPSKCIRPNRALMCNERHHARKNRSR